MSENNNDNKAVGKGCLIFFAIVFGLAVIITMATGDGSDEGPTKLTAYSMTQGWVEDRLKSPSTADFPGGRYDEHTTQIDDNTFRVSSYVDSQNSFGAEIRTHFEAEVEFLGDDKWRLNRLDFFE